MSRLGSYELTHPELLSESQLCGILKNTCIEVLNFEKLCKNELVEMYKRVAMPLPQRQRDNDKDFNAEEDTLEKYDASVRDNDISNLTASGNVENNKVSRSYHSQADKIKRSINDQTSMSKKIRLCSTSKVESACNGVNKRKCDERNEESLVSKRQKIIWP